MNGFHKVVDAYFFVKAFTSPSIFIYPVCCVIMRLYYQTRLEQNIAAELRADDNAGIAVKESNNRF